MSYADGSSPFPADVTGSSGPSGCEWILMAELSFALDRTLSHGGASSPAALHLHLPAQPFDVRALPQRLNQSRISVVLTRSCLPAQLALHGHTRLLARNIHRPRVDTHAALCHQVAQLSRQLFISSDDKQDPSVLLRHV